MLAVFFLPVFSTCLSLFSLPSSIVQPSSDHLSTVQKCCATWHCLFFVFIFPFYMCFPLLTFRQSMAFEMCQLFGLPVDNRWLLGKHYSSQRPWWAATRTLVPWILAIQTCKTMSNQFCFNTDTTSEMPSLMSTKNHI